MISEQSKSGLYFFLIVAIVYVVVLFTSLQTFLSALRFASGILLKVIPVLVLIYFLLVLTDRFLKPAKVVRYLGEGSGWKGWLYSIVGGILSTGPIYMWYPLMNELKKNGMRNGLIACFLHNRAIKPALLPIFIQYFGIVYVLVLTVITVIASVVQGIVVERLLEVRK